jgi:hypothetical protein
MSGQNGQRARFDLNLKGPVAAPAWKTILVDSLGFVLVVWSIPAAILLVGTPIVLVAALVAASMRWILQP